MTLHQNNLVILEYSDLLEDPRTASSKFDTLLSKAFGNATIVAEDTTASPLSSLSNLSPLGLIAIRNVPEFTSTKHSFLRMAHTLANLPKPYLEGQLTDETSLFNAGWSHGKEKLGINNTPDYSKASFYFNPITDTPGSIQDRLNYPVSYPTNKWPEESLIPGFKPFGTKLGCIMKDVVTLLAKHIDVYVKNRGCEYGVPTTMSEEMENTEKVKGRLLYYYPLELDDDTIDNNNNNTNIQNDVINKHDSWIGWHNDSGFLTALSGDIYIDHKTGIEINKDEVDPNAGLYVMDRCGIIQKVDIPDDCMAIQIGECLQIVTGGLVVSTPHCVRGVDPKYYNQYDHDDEGVMTKRKIARISFPCFVDTVPSYELRIPRGCTREEVLQSGVHGCAHVPPLEDRWLENGMSFGAFLQKTFSTYYEWSKK